MIRQSFLNRSLIDALYTATLLEMLSAKSDEYPSYFAVRGACLSALVGGKWSSYRRSEMRKLAKVGKVIIEYHFGSLVYRLDREYFESLHGISRVIVGDNSIRLPNPLQLTFVK